MSKFKILSVIIAIGVFCILLSCEEKTVTQSEDKVQLSGYVYQKVNGYFSYISKTEINVGDYATTSDSLGKYFIDIPKGEYVIQAMHERFDTTTTSVINISYNRSYAIKLQNGPVYSVSGVVTDTIGTVVEGAIVELEHFSDTTDINGEFSFQNVPSGPRRISCDYSDYYIFKDSFEIGNSDIVKNIQLVRQGYNISGTVSHPVDGLLSGIEVVLDDSFYDTTNINGAYLFENIFIGEHQLQIYSEIYDNQIIDFSLGKADIVQNYELIKTIFYIQTVDTLWIEKDAMVKQHEYLDYSVHNTSNYGEDTTLELYRDYLDYFSMVDGYIYRNEVTRIFMELPNSVDLQADSIYLVLSFNQFFYYYDQFDITFSGILDYWDELTINWENQPISDSIFILVEQNFQRTNRLEVKLTDYVSLLNSTNGLRISIKNEICNACWAGIWFYSSECDLIVKRPHLIVYKTEPIP